MTEEHFPTYEKWARLKYHMTANGNFLCPDCEGTGKAYDWADRDPIEGWKMATKKTCQECNGYGVVSHIHFFKEYLEEQKRFYRNKEKMTYLQRKRAEIQGKLTEDELSFIKLFGLFG